MEPASRAYFDFVTTAQQSRAEPASAPSDALLGYAVAQIHGVYVLAQNANGLVLVDMHAAHERILYERLKNAIDAGPPVTQPLLIPVLMSVSATELATAEDHRDTLAQLGFEVAPAGPQQLAVRSAPALVAGGDIATLLRALLAAQ
jgi:DNA mismatch repair protein MutL